VCSKGLVNDQKAISKMLRDQVQLFDIKFAKRVVEITGDPSQYSEEEALELVKKYQKTSQRSLSWDDISSGLDRSLETAAMVVRRW
jgi:hypothetical protein